MIHISSNLLFSSLYATVIFASNHPNIIFILTDDQDVLLGGMEPLRETRSLIGGGGITFQNMFATTPLCCPSRASILTGRYIHNHRVVNNSVAGNCSSRHWQHGPERDTFVTSLRQRGYNTFFAGKYLNKYGKKRVGGVKHVPPGWDSWVGLVGNSVYYNYTLSVNGKKERHGSSYHSDYLTDLIERRGSEFLQQQTTDHPFFMMLSTPACHSPFTPAPQYRNAYMYQNAPKTGSYNIHGKNKHWLVRVAPNPMSNDSVEVSNSVFRNRWRTLLSVDDLVRSIINQLRRQKLINNTYVFFSSDNGYHLGQFSLPMDKRQMYEFDLRVPLLVRGPGVTPGQISDFPVLTIDLAPTFLDIAGLKPTPGMDGRSFLPLMLSKPDYRHDNVESIDGRHGNIQSDTAMRRDFLVEYYGEFVNKVRGCPQYDGQFLANCYPDCVCEDGRNNTYNCVRSFGPQHSVKFCRFTDTERFIEVYDLKNDPDELDNLASRMDAATKTQYTELLRRMSSCTAASCSSLHPAPSIMTLSSTAEPATFFCWLDIVNNLLFSLLAVVFDYKDHLC